MTGGHRGRKLLQAQRSHGLPPLGPPPKNLNDDARRAWRDVVEASPVVLLAMNELIVSIAATTLLRWRSGERDPSLLKLTYACLGDLFIPMPERRRLMFPDRSPRR